MILNALEFVSVIDIVMLAVGLVSVVLGIFAIVMGKRSERTATEMHEAAILMNKDTQEINRDTHQMALLAEQFAMHPFEMERLRKHASDGKPSQITLSKDTLGDQPIRYTYEDIASVMRELDTYRIPSHTVIIDELPGFLSSEGITMKTIPVEASIGDSPYELLRLRAALARHGVRLTLFPVENATDDKEA